MTFQNSLLTQLLSEAFVTALWPNQLSQSFVSPCRSLCMSVCQTGYKHVSGPCEVNSKALNRFATCKQQHATRHYRKMVASSRKSHQHMNIYEFCMISFLSSFWLKKTYACEVGLINVSKTQRLLLNSSMMMSMLPLARERVDESSNAPTNVPMSHIHHATIAVIHNRNPVLC